MGQGQSVPQGDCGQLAVLPYVPLKLVLQYVLANEGSAALRCRLVSQSWNDAMLMNLHIHLLYEFKPKVNRCAVSLHRFYYRDDKPPRKFFPTAELLNSQLFKRHSDLKVTGVDDSSWDQADLIKLATAFNRPIDVALRSNGSFHLSVLPLAAMPKLRVISTDTQHCHQLDMRELNFIETLTNVRTMRMASEHLLELSQRADQQKIVYVGLQWKGDNGDWQTIANRFVKLPRLAIMISQEHHRFDFDGTFSHLKWLYIGAKSLSQISFNLAYLPSLSQLGIETQRYGSIIGPNGTTDVTWLLRSLPAAMPNLKRLQIVLRLSKEYPIIVGNRISEIFQFCPATVTHLLLATQVSPDTRKLSRRDFDLHMTRIFADILRSKVERVQLNTVVKPKASRPHVQSKLDSRPFQYENSPDGIQLGPPMMMTDQRGNLLHIYNLIKSNDDKCTVEVTYGSGDRYD